MKHHVILLRETPILGGTYLQREFNFTDDDELVPFPNLTEDCRKLTHKEVQNELLIKHGFIERFPVIEQMSEDNQPINIPIGQATFLEIALAGSSIISMFFFNTLGLPTIQVVYDLRLKEV